MSATIVVQPGRLLARTDSTGAAEVRGVGAGVATVRVLAFGFRGAQRDVNAVADSTIAVAFVVQRNVAELSPVVAVGRSAERQELEAPAAPSVARISGADVRMVPSLGEADVLRAAALLPGVTARNDFWAGFNIRGGESGQVLVQLDGHPLFSPFHLGGLFSTFLPDAVDDVEVRTGSLPASYGGRLSGALDVSSRTDPRPGVHGGVNVSLISSSAVATGTFADSRGTWTAGARRTYADLFVNLFRKDALPYHFQDAQAHAELATAGGGRVALTGYAGADVMDVTGETPVRFGWGNRLAGVTWVQPLGARTTLTHRASWSTFGTWLHVIDGRDTTELLNRIGEVRAAVDVERKVAAHALRAGVSWSALRARYDEHIPYEEDDNEPSAADTVVRQRLGVLSLFAEDTWAAGSRLSVRPGVRYDRAAQASWAAWSPRLALKFRATGDLALTASAGRYAQWVHSVRNEDLPIRVVDVWITSGREAPVSTGTEVVGGFEWWLSRSDFVRLEGYRKTYDGLIEPSHSIDPRLRFDDLRTFAGISRGIDFHARHVAGERFSGWVSYSYGVSERWNAEERYAPAHDRRHDLNLVGTWRGGPKWSFGSVLHVASGTPYTGWSGSYGKYRYSPFNNRWEHDYDEEARGPRNGERYPGYARLDVSAHRTIRRGRREWEPYLNVVNVLNRRNVFMYTRDQGHEGTGDTMRLTGVAQLPVLPTLGMRVSF